MTSTVGVIGIGNMGLAMALRLRDLGRAVVVRDIDAAREALALEAGCRVAADPAAVAAACHAVIVAVIDAAQAREVLFGPRGAAGSGSAARTVVLCPTIAAEDTAAIAAELARAGMACIDAPMSGGPQRAREGTMSLMVACDDAVFAQHQSLLQQLADPVFRVGTRPGDGARTKLVNNLLAAVNLAGAAEALALAVRLGLDPAVTLAVIERSSGQSWIGSERMRRALAGDTRVGAHVELLAKDSRLAVAAARGCAAATPVGDAAAAAFVRALAAGLGRDDDSVLWRWLLEAGGGTDAAAGAQWPSSRKG